jgi:hypothetical protein
MAEETGREVAEEVLELRLSALQAISDGDLDRAMWLRTRLLAVLCDPNRPRDPEGLASLRSVDRFLIPALEAEKGEGPIPEQLARRPRLTRLRLFYRGG